MKTRKKRNNSFLVINNIINLIYLQSDVISNDLESDFVTHLFLNQRGKKKNFEKGRIDNFLLHRNLNRWYVYFLQNYFLTCPVGKTINIRNLMNKKNFLKTIDILIETSTILFNFHVILLGNLYIKFFQKKKKGITFEFLTLQKLNKKINRGSVLHFKKNVTGFRYFYFYVKRERLVTKIKKTLHHSLLVKRDFEPQFM